MTTMTTAGEPSFYTLTDAKTEPFTCAATSLFW
jgi:hypothetical protein